MSLPKKSTGGYRTKLHSDCSTLAMDDKLTLSAISTMSSLRGRLFADSERSPSCLAGKSILEVILELI